MLLEAASSLLKLAVLLSLSGCWASRPARGRRWTMLAAFGLASASFSCAGHWSARAAAHQQGKAGKSVHPLVYLAMPISGTFFLLEWLS